MTADIIIKNYLEAVGGEKALRAIETQTTLYKVFMQTRKDYLVNKTVERKGTLKSQRVPGDRYLFFDGEKLWNIQGEKKQELKGAVVEQFRKRADLDGPFLDYQKKGITLELVGKERVEFSEFWVLSATFSDQTKILYYFDPADGLLKMKKEPSFRMVNGKISPGPLTLTYYYDFKTVAGILYPHLWIQTDEKLGHMHLFQVEEIRIK